MFGSKKKEIFTRIKNKFNIKKYLINNLNFNRNIKIHYIDHHLSHIASSFYPSNFEESLAISIDGFGDFASLNIAKCKKNQIKILHKIFFPNSIGIFYEMMTQLLGFKNYGDEYKLMGLASYGKPIYFEKLKNNLFKNSELFELNCDYFNCDGGDCGVWNPETEQCEPAPGQIIQYNDVYYMSNKQIEKE